MRFTTTAKMRIAICGQRSFGLAVLDQLDGIHEIGLVVSPPEDLLHAGAQRHEVPWRASITPEDVAGIDLIVAAHSHTYLGRRTRSAARLGALGYHPSLLPRHRGRDAVRWTIHMRDAIAGGSVYWLSDNVDCGPIAMQDWCHVRPDDDASSLWRRELFPMGLDLLTAVLDDVEQDIITMRPQDASCSTWEPSFETQPIFRPELPELASVPHSAS